MSATSRDSRRRCRRHRSWADAHASTLVRNHNSLSYLDLRMVPLHADRGRGRFCLVVMSRTGSGKWLVGWGLWGSCRGHRSGPWAAFWVSSTAACHKSCHNMRGSRSSARIHPRIPSSGGPRRSRGSATTSPSTSPCPPERVRPAGWPVVRARPSRRVSFQPSGRSTRRPDTLDGTREPHEESM